MLDRQQAERRDRMAIRSARSPCARRTPRACASAISPTRRARLDRLDDGRHQVVACRAPRPSTASSARRHAARIARRAHRAHALDLPRVRSPDRCCSTSIRPRRRRSRTRLTPTTTLSPASIACCARYADSWISRWIRPCSIAASVPPAASMRSSSAARAVLDLVGQLLDGVRRRRADRRCWRRRSRRR